MHSYGQPAISSNSARCHGVSAASIPAGTVITPPRCAEDSRPRAVACIATSYEPGIEGSSPSRRGRAARSTAARSTAAHGTAAHDTAAHDTAARPLLGPPGPSVLSSHVFYSRKCPIPERVVFAVHEGAGLRCVPSPHR